MLRTIQPKVNNFEYCTPSSIYKFTQRLKSIHLKINQTTALFVHVPKALPFTFIFRSYTLHIKSLET